MEAVALVGAGILGLAFLANQPNASKAVLPEEETDVGYAVAEGANSTPSRPPPAPRNLVDYDKENLPLGRDPIRDEEATPSLEVTDRTEMTAHYEEPQSAAVWDTYANVRLFTARQYEAAKFHGVWAPTVSGYK